MNNCFAVIIKEKGCQNDAYMKSQKALTSISINEPIFLTFGYQVSITNVVCNNIHIVLTNPSLGFSVNFTLQNSSDILLDLPLDNGCYRLYIAITVIDCANIPVCPTTL